MPSSNRPKPTSPSAKLARFDLVERLVHWSTAIMMLTLILTGASLYFPALSIRVGHRGLVENIHVITGLCLLGPVVLGLAGPWRKGLLMDLRRFDRWGSSDFDWFRSLSRRKGLARDKFNGGQKIEADFLGAAMLATLVTGVIMRFAPSSWITWATGATLVHEVLFFGITAAVLAHIAFALSRPQQLASMFSGRISRAWARVHAAAWLSEIEASELEVATAETPEVEVPRLAPAPPAHISHSPASGELPDEPVKGSPP